MNRLKNSIERQWYSRPDWLLPLVPFTLLFRLLAALRRHRQSAAALILPLPVIVVGNIAVGGTGKTPALIALCCALRAAGRRPVVISRAYGTRQARPRQLPPDATAADYGDEPVLIAQATQCPVVVGSERIAAAQLALRENLGDVILSDDGLQHYRLARTWEIAVIDARRRLGNGWCLPVGPLREPATRLRQVDAILVNGGLFAAPWLPQDRTYAMTLRPRYWRHVQTGRQLAPDQLDLTGAHAIAGIGHPQRFFQTLGTLGFAGTISVFGDHHAYRPEDLAAWRDDLLLMTEKDAVKVRDFAAEHWWALGVEADIPAPMLQALLQALPPLAN